MRDISHWTPAYIFYRFQDVLYRKMNPDSPWLTPGAIDFLKSILQKEHCGLEYGSGRSTTWFATRVNQLVSVEHNPEWYERVSQAISLKRISNVAYYLHPKPTESNNISEIIASPYVIASGELQSGSLDFALVDGVVRPACALRSISLLKQGGWLILDDANHYLPGTSGAPNSRKLSDGPLNEDWAAVQSALQGWNALWYGNGIKETLIFQKP